MSLLRPISIFLRNALIRQHPYFSCCASCGEIKTPLGKRLCTSLSFSLPLDIVLVAEPGSEASTFAARARQALTMLAQTCPWAHRIFLITPDTANVPAGVHGATFLAQSDFMPPNAALEPIAYLHELPGLQDHYLIIPLDAVPDKTVTPLDFFTPNGIPIMHYASQTQDAGTQEGVLAFSDIIIAQTKENSADFLQNRQSTRPAQGFSYPEALGNWAFSAGRLLLMGRAEA